MSGKRASKRRKSCQKNEEATICVINPNTTTTTSGGPTSEGKSSTEEPIKDTDRSREAGTSPKIYFPTLEELPMVRNAPRIDHLLLLEYKEMDQVHGTKSKNSTVTDSKTTKECSSFPFIKVGGVHAPNLSQPTTSPRKPEDHTVSSPTSTAGRPNRSMSDTPSIALVKPMAPSKKRRRGKSKKAAVSKQTIQQNIHLEPETSHHIEPETPAFTAPIALMRQPEPQTLSVTELPPTAITANPRRRVSHVEGARTYPNKKVVITESMLPKITPTESVLKSIEDRKHTLQGLRDWDPNESIPSGEEDEFADLPLPEPTFRVPWSDDEQGESGKFGNPTQRPTDYFATGPSLGSTGSYREIYEPHMMQDQSQNPYLNTFHPMNSEQASYQPPSLPESCQPAQVSAYGFDPSISAGNPNYGQLPEPSEQLDYSQFLRYSSVDPGDEGEKKANVNPQDTLNEPDEAHVIKAKMSWFREEHTRLLKKKQEEEEQIAQIDKRIIERLKLTDQWEKKQEWPKRRSATSGSTERTKDKGYDLMEYIRGNLSNDAMTMEVLFMKVFAAVRDASNDEDDDDDTEVQDDDDEKM